MLVSRQLDDQRYADIVQEAKGRLPWLCPVWTDHNAHDPGITILELMAWYKEMQQYHMDQVTPAIQRRLLALAGARARPAQAARCAVEVGADCPAQRTLARLTNRQGMAFELTEPIPKVRAELYRVLVEAGGERRDVTAMMDQSFRPFSFGDGASSALLLGFRTLPEGELRLWFQVEEPAGNRRLPPDGQMPPPRRLVWERMGLGAVQPVRTICWWRAWTRPTCPTCSLTFMAGQGRRCIWTCGANGPWRRSWSCCATPWSGTGPFVPPCGGVWRT